MDVVSIIRRGIQTVLVLGVCSLALAANTCKVPTSPGGQGCNPGQFKCITVLNTKGFSCFTWAENNATNFAYVCLDDSGKPTGAPQVSLEDLNTVLSRNPGTRCAAKVRCTR